QSGSMLCPGCGPNVIELTAFPSMAMKVYAILGMMRWAGIGLATFISGMLIRFGGTVLAMVAGQIAGAPMGAGSQAGVSGIKDPHGYVGSELVPRMAFTNAAFEVGGFRAYAMGRVAGATFAEASSVSAGYQTMAHTGGSFSGVASAGLSAGTVGATQNIASTVQGFGISRAGGPGLVGEGLGKMQLMNALKSAETGKMFSIDDVLNVSSVLGQKSAGSIKGTADRYETLAQKTGVSISTVAEREAKSGKLTFTLSELRNLIQRSGLKLPDGLAEKDTTFLIERIAFDATGKGISFIVAQGADSGNMYKIEPQGITSITRPQGQAIEIGRVKYYFSGEREDIYSSTGAPLKTKLFGIFTDPQGKQYTGQVIVNLESGEVISSNLTALKKQEEGNITNVYGVEQRVGNYQILGGKLEVIESPSGGKVIDIKDGIVQDGVTGRKFRGSFYLYQNPSGDAVLVSAESRSIHSVLMSVSDPEQKERLARFLESMGYKTAAAHVRRMKAVTVSMDIDPNTGRISYIRVHHGSEVLKIDFTHVKKGLLREWFNFEKSVQGALHQIYNNRREVFSGANFMFGNDLLSIIYRSDHTAFHSKYGIYAWNNPEYRSALLSDVTEVTKKFGSIDKLEVDKYARSLSYNAGFNLNDPLVKGAMAAGGVLSLIPQTRLAGTTIAALAALKASLSSEKSGTDRISTNDIMFHYNELIEELAKRKDLSDEQKSRLFVESAHELYKFLESVNKTSAFRRGFRSMPELNENKEQPYTIFDLGEKVARGVIRKVRSKDNLFNAHMNMYKDREVHTNMFKDKEGQGE
ncbi:MAG: hypothetical protein QW607_10505, partial [Desulfurococcaceae archaeon]